uniref:TR10B factor n=1 Tax=Accipiter nisus TaxID=211598 RepID=A0A8B9MJI0_9AVES
MFTDTPFLSPPLPQPPLLAGTYVAEQCKEQNGSSECLPCKEDEYIEYPNSFTKCLGCRTCREGRDQVELSPCQAVRDTQCACKNGTFCSPDHPCEMCQKCRPHLPRLPLSQVSQGRSGAEDQEQLPTQPLLSTLDNLIATIVVVVFVVVVVLALLVWKCCCRRSPGEHRVRGSPGALALAGGGVCMDVGWVGRGTSFPFPPLVLRRSFDIFARDVPFKDWKRFGRALELLENDIALAEMNDRYSLEPFFQMLNTWQNRQGMNASVNTLLETLHQINLGGIAEDISSKLVQQGSFQYEGSWHHAMASACRTSLS